MASQFENPEDWLLVWFVPRTASDDLPWIAHREDLNVWLIESDEQWALEVERLRQLGAKEIQPDEARAMSQELAELKRLSRSKMPQRPRKRG